MVRVNSKDQIDVFPQGSASDEPIAVSISKMNIGPGFSDLYGTFGKESQFQENPI